MTATETKLMHATAACDNVSLDLQAIFTNGQNLLALASEAREKLLHRMASSSGISTPLHLGRGIYELQPVLQGEIADTFVAAEALASVVTSSPQFIEASKLLTPLIARVRELEAALEAEKMHVHLTRVALAEAQQAATDKAIASLEKDPAIVKARKELAALVPPEDIPEAPPFRGKVQLTPA